MRLAFLLAFAVLAHAEKPSLAGDFRQWSPVEITFDGPDSSEGATPNPFLDYRLTVTFTHSSGTKCIVPGFYAADGNAAETSATSGRKWRVFFTPDLPGEWRYVASFRTGRGVAIADDPAAGEAAGFDGVAGTFRIFAVGRSTRGMLRYVGGHYLQWAGTGEPFLKGGADSPENFLAYADFDGTFDTRPTANEGNPFTAEFLHKYGPHLRDWREGDPTWQGGKGKAIIGALDYLASKGMNSVYFLTYNIDGGDGSDTWMWTGPNERERFDVSKLAQWEIVFRHMDRLGLQLHVITQETENDSKLGGSAGLNPVRKLYYRELAARFAHHLAVMWNQGEENNTSDADRKEIARYIRGLDPYRHPITVHTHNNKAPEFYDGIIGDAFFEASSIQSDMSRYNRDAIALRERTAKAGRKWAIFGDEQASADNGVLPDSADAEHDVPRTQALWGNLMGGGSGVEWYFGYKYPNMDLNCEDWRSRDRMWDQTRYALEFFRNYLPFQEMQPDNSLAAGAYVLANPGHTYAVYLPNGGSTKLEVARGSYTVQWYNPRSGGALQSGTVTKVSGPGRVSLGQAPSDPSRDWAVLVRSR